jgi:hypothetical protein
MFGLDALSGAGLGGDLDPEMLQPLAASGKADFQLEFVGAVEVPNGAIEGDEGRINVRSLVKNKIGT